MKILVSIFTMGNIRAELSEVISMLKKDDRVTLEYSTDVPYENNRNKAARRVLEGGFDYWLGIDEDNPPTRNPLELVDLDLDIVACPTPQWQKTTVPPLIWLVGEQFDDGYRCYTDRKQGLQEVAIVSSGCLLVARRVLEAVPAPFMRKWNEHGEVTLGTDYHFCERARQAGFRVWAHWDFVCSHFKTVNLLDFIS